MAAASDRELKKGNAELLILALLEDRAGRRILADERSRSDAFAGAVNRIVEVRHA